MAVNRLAHAIALTVSMLTLAAPATLAQQPSQPPTPTIRVSGVGEVRVAPDEVVLSFGASTFAKDVKEAKAANDARIKALLAVATRFEIKPEDMQTGEIRISVQYERTHDGRAAHNHVDGYDMHRGVTLVLRDVKKFESLLTALVEAGANQFDGIQFRSSEIKKHREAAREMALRAAAEKAGKMAAALGRKAGPAITIEENTDSTYTPRWSNLTQNVRMDGAGDANGETFAEGQIAITASVSVMFGLE
ncbi:MAG: SIMPL domain-containing protein [Phycisphaerae bacterium]